MSAAAQAQGVREHQRSASIAMHGHEPWRLMYWPGIPGRGEFVRLVCEGAGIPYVEPAREKGGPGAAAVGALMGGASSGFPIAAPPVLQSGPDEGKSITVSQSMNIVSFLSEAYGLAPADIGGRYAFNALLHTIADVVAEAHDTHHPLDLSKYYEDQIDASKVRAEFFRSTRIPKFLAYFERALAHNEHNKEGDANTGAWYFGAESGPADWATWHTLAGLQFAFPKAFAKHFSSSAYPLLHRLYAAVPQHKRLAEYLASSWHQAFNNNGIFRALPELDDQ